MHDLTTKLANYALTFEGKAAAERQVAELERTPTAGDAEYDRAMRDLPVAAARAEAAKYNELAANARRGFLGPIRPDDASFIMCNQALYDEAASAHRVIWVKPAADPAMPFAG